MTSNTNRSFDNVLQAARFMQLRDKVQTTYTDQVQRLLINGKAARGVIYKENHVYIAIYPFAAADALSVVDVRGKEPQLVIHPPFFRDVEKWIALMLSMDIIPDKLLNNIACHDVDNDRGQIIADIEALFDYSVDMAGEQGRL